jgi:hypothetical protein
MAHARYGDGHEVTFGLGGKPVTMQRRKLTLVSAAAERQERLEIIC